MRKFFVNHEGKKDLIITLNSRPVESPEGGNGDYSSEWGDCIHQFTHMIEENVHSSVHPMINTQFSTTSEIDRVVMHVSIMDMCKSYFQYSVVIGCGIPWIELIGTPEDWTLLKLRVIETLEHLQMKWWLDELSEVLEYFERAAQGNIGDGRFWRSVVFKMGGSGMIGDPVTGWLQVFFPYLQGENGRYFRNNSLASWKNDQIWTRTPGEVKGRNIGRRPDAVNLQNIPSGISSAPFLLIDLLTNEKLNMAFGGGLTSVVRGEDGALEVTTGYAVVEKY